MGVAVVPRGDHERVYLQHLLSVADEAIATLLHSLDMQSHPSLWSIMLNTCNLAAGKDAMLPLGLVGILDSLEIHLIVDFLNELDSDNAVVRGFVGLEGALALSGREVIELVGSFWVENFVHTGVELVSAGARRTVMTYKGESSLGLMAVSLMMSEVLELGYRFWRSWKISAALWPLPRTAML